MSDEWVHLGKVDNILPNEVMGALKAVVRCRRVVQVRWGKDGLLHFFARVPLPRKVKVPTAELQPSLPQE